MLEVHGLKKRYGRKKPILEGVSFSVRPDSITCLIGLNGEGKSTILKAIMGLVPVDAGTVLVDGEVSREKIAFVPDLQTMPGYMTIGDALLYMSDYYPDWNPKVAEELMGLVQVIDDRQDFGIVKRESGEVQSRAWFCTRPSVSVARRTVCRN